ncbi:MAG TPA: hypothetical protein VM243_08420 [Phycisphaerae bacterium]|nr:hypothetical protein [Phycisphaerae bacterium]
MPVDLSRLDASPRSISRPQRERLFGLAKRRGMTIDALRAAVGGSISQLSKREASEAISRLGGKPLTHEPGHPPAPPHRRSERGVTRMIANDQVEQIMHGGLTYFGGDVGRFSGWLAKDFDCGGAIEPGEDLAGVDRRLCAQIRTLATAQRGGQVIHVLRTMNARNDGPSRAREEAAQVSG